MRLPPFALLLSLPFLVHCAPARPAEPPSLGASGQTYRQAIETICNVDALASLSIADDPLGADVQRFAWLEEHVDNPEGIYLRTVLSVKTPPDRSGLLREAAQVVGLGSCALADSEAKRGSDG